MIRRQGERDGLGAGYRVPNLESVSVFDSLIRLFANRCPCEAAPAERALAATLSHGDRVPSGMAQGDSRTRLLASRTRIESPGSSAPGGDSAAGEGGMIRASGHPRIKILKLFWFFDSLIRPASSGADVARSEGAGSAVREFFFGVRRSRRETAGLRWGVSGAGLGIPRGRKPHLYRHIGCLAAAGACGAAPLAGRNPG